MIRTRTSRPADIPALVEIWRGAVDATHDFLTPADRIEIEALVANHYLPNAALFVAVGSDDRPVGFLGGEGRTIDSLFVAPDRMGRGIGSALIATFDADGDGPLLVDVNEANASGLAFYRAKGFEVVGRSPLDSDGRPYPLLHLRRD